MTLEQFHRVTKALADPQRFAMLQLIAGSTRETPCRTIVDRFGVTPATVSHHLKELATAGLIHIRKQGQCAYLSARAPVIAAYQQRLAAKLTPRKAKARPAGNTSRAGTRATAGVIPPAGAASPGAPGDAVSRAASRRGSS